MAPEFILYAITGGALTLYAVLGGADFGAGVWEFARAFRTSAEERALTNRAMGPIWETNHVWLIFVIVLLFSAFPPAFAALCRALWLPLLLAVVGIVFRGTGFALRYHAAGARQRGWSIVFALASTFTPLFLGAAMGAVASGKLEVTETGHFTGNYLSSWISALSVFTGFFFVGLCAYLAAVFLTRDAHREGLPGLERVWRGRAIAMAVCMGVFAMAGLAVVATTAPILKEAFLSKAWPLVAASILAGTVSLACMLRERFTAAALTAALAVATVILGLAVAQYPALIPHAITVSTAKSPDNILWLLVWSILGGAVLLVPSLIYLLYVFKGTREDKHT